MSIWEVLNPAYITKTWTVSIENWGGGQGTNFWFKEDALAFIKMHHDEGIFIDLINNIILLFTERKRNDVS